jgi:hypothetical protein
MVMGTDVVPSEIETLVCPPVVPAALMVNVVEGPACDAGETVAIPVFALTAVKFPAKFVSLTATVKDVVPPERLMV